MRIRLPSALALFFALWFALLTACPGSSPAPEVTLTVPDDPLSGTVTLTLSGEMEELELFVDGESLDSGPGPELVTDWDTTTVEDGEHEISGQGIDADGDSSWAYQTVKVAQDGGGTVPEVTFSEPGDGETFEPGSDIAVEVDASDDDGIESLVLEADGDELDTFEGEGPYTYTWSGAAEGDHTLTATATDATGETGSAEVDIEVTAGGTGSLTCGITEPIDDARVSGEVEIKAEAASDAGVVSVEFTADEEVICEDTEADWACTWDASDRAGERVGLGITATDGEGETCTDEVRVRVGDPCDEQVTASIQSPTEGETVSGGVQVQVVACAPEGISQVEFLLDGESRFVDTETDWSWTWDSTEDTDGEHTLEALATETDTGETASAEITVTVDNSGGDTGAPDTGSADPDTGGA